jgi:hypothetical protein
LRGREAFMAVSGRKRREFGDRVSFKSLACAPVNELGVVYLFGVLHEAFDFKIESIQAGFPDCIARRKIGPNRWEELRIEFEYDSKSFKVHGHDPTEVDMIVCWEHNWRGCPEGIEVIALSELIGETERIGREIRSKKTLNEWQKFCQQKRLEGLDFSEIARLWKSRKAKKIDSKAVNKRPLNEWQKFCQQKRLEGLDFSEIARLWKSRKEERNK